MDLLPSNKLDIEILHTHEGFHRKGKEKGGPGWYFHVGNDAGTGSTGYWCGEYSGPYPTAAKAIAEFASLYAILGHDREGIYYFGPPNDGN